MELRRLKKVFGVGAENLRLNHKTTDRGPACPSHVPASPVSVLLWGRNCPTTDLGSAAGMFCSTIVIIHIPGWRLNVLHMRRRFQWTGRVSGDVPQTPYLDSSVPICSGAQIQIQMFSLNWDLTGLEDRMKTRACTSVLQSAATLRSSVSSLHVTSESLFVHRR